jgi:hypothetical protein
MRVLAPIQLDDRRREAMSAVGELLMQAAYPTSWLARTAFP